MIYFVGMHNKPGKKPLDSSTMTGKVIDAIIEQFNYSECVKTNLFDEEYLPNDEEFIDALVYVWLGRYQPTNKDVIVLLGQWVDENFHLAYLRKRVITVPHPAGIFGPANKAKYISETVGKIKEVLNHSKN